MTTSYERLDAAWDDLENNLGRLHVLAQDGPGDLRDVHRGSGRSGLARLIDIAETLSLLPDDQSRQRFEIALDIIITHLPDESVYVKAAIKPLTRFVVISNLRGSSRTLPFDKQHARLVLRSLVELKMEIIDGHTPFKTTKALAGPYLACLDSSDPLVLTFNPPNPTQSPAVPNTPRHLLDLTHALENSSSTPTTTPFQITPADLLEVLAPQYLGILRSAPSPPFQIHSTHSPSTNDQANAFAGKVYSSHEFRNREAGLPTGLGIGRLSNAGMGMGGGQGSEIGRGQGMGHGCFGKLPGGDGGGGANQGSGMGMGIGMSVELGAGPALGGGLGLSGGLSAGGGVLSRPASRHVDDYAR